MKTGIIHNNYHWNSYSIVRSLVEGLTDIYDCDIVSCDDDLSGYDVVFIIGRQLKVLFLHEKPKIIRFGLSDPHMFNVPEYVESDIYFTISEQIADKYEKAVYMPVFSDSRYFKPLDVPKKYDCIFTGSTDHPTVKHRRAVVDRLRDNGVSVLCCGYGWDQDHNDNVGFVEGYELINAINSARLSLDIGTGTSSISSRLFHASMCGVPSVTLYREDVERLYTDNSIIFAPVGKYVETVIKQLEYHEIFLADISCNTHEYAFKNHDLSNRLELIDRTLHDANILV